MEYSKAGRLLAPLLTSEMDAIQTKIFILPYSDPINMINAMKMGIYGQSQIISI